MPVVEETSVIVAPLIANTEKLVSFFGYVERGLRSVAGERGRGRNSSSV